MKNKSIVHAAMIKAAFLGGAFLALMGAMACGSNQSSGSASTAFPSGLAVASPFDTVASDAAALTSSTSVAAVTTSSPVSRYTWATGKIDQILSGTSPSLCVFDPSLFLRLDSDAACYGPTVPYQAHPNATGPGDPNYNGTLPSGDVGLWMETNPTDSNACAAAELNSRMEGVRAKSMASLSGLASLICTANSAGIALPSNSTQDLTTEMNALGIADTTFTSASISHSNASGSDEYSYALDFNYSPGGTTHRIVVAMIHIPSGTAGQYRGRLSYRVNDSFTGGNCPSTDVTSNGSLLYNSARTTSMNLEVRQASFCAHDSDGTTDGLVDPSKKFNAGTDPTGWGNNFGILTANFDPQTMIGDFAYSWQAGPLDGNTRVFNIHTDETAFAATTIPNGQAFFGYGADIDGSDGGINGFICNWAGPGNSHVLKNFAQHQQVAFDSSSGVFQSVAADISYAPTNSCNYDGTGSFRYDSDASGTVDTAAATPITNDLAAMTDADGDGNFDEISGDGFALPTPPTNL